MFFLDTVLIFFAGKVGIHIILTLGPATLLHQQTEVNLCSHSSFLFFYSL